MAASIANSTKVTGGTVTSLTTTGFTSTTGNVVFVCIHAELASSISTVTDNKGNTYTQLGTIQSTLYGDANVYYCNNAAGGSNHTCTVTWTASTAGPVVIFAEANGVISAAMDTASKGQASEGEGASPWEVTSGTLTQADNLAISFLAIANTVNPSVYVESTGFTTIQEEVDNVLYFGSAVATKSVTAKTALTPSWTSASSVGAAMFVFVLRSLAEADPKPRKRRRATSTFDYTSGGWFHAQVAGAGSFDKDLLYPASTPGVYTLPVDPATYTLTAANETLSATRALSFDPAVYTLTAAAQTLSVGRAISFDPATYVLTAADETLTATRALSIDPASYVLSAANITLSVGKNLSVDPASYALTASDQTLTATRALSIDLASYSLNAAAITLSAGRVLSVDAQTYTLTTSAETLSVARALNIEPAAYVLSAAPVTLTHTTASPVLSIDPVSYALTTADISFEVTRAGAVGGGGQAKRRKLIEKAVFEANQRIVEEEAAQAAAEAAQKAQQAPPEPVQAPIEAPASIEVVPAPALPVVDMAAVTNAMANVAAAEQTLLAHAAMLAALAEDDDEEALLLLI